MTQQPAAGGETSDRRNAEPESLRLRSMTPSFTVDDLERSLAFYVDGLGFTLEERWEEDGELRGVMLVAGDCRLGLSQDDWSKGRERKKGIGFRVWSETAQDLDALSERLGGHGIEHDGPKDESWGARTISVVDPDGYCLTLTSPHEG